MGAAGLVLGSAACTLLLDRSATQCQSDSDCARFGAHPYCENSVCVDSGLGPDPCFYGTPQQPQDFENQCTTAGCFPFDNCGRLKLCGGNDPALVMPPMPEASTAAATTDPDGGDAAVMPNCFDLTNGRTNATVITGSSNFPPLLGKLAKLAIASNLQTVFQTTNSCTGVKSVFNSVAIYDPPPGSAASKYATYFGNDGTQQACLLGSDGAQVDIGESDIFSSTCDGFGPPGDSVSEALGPIQAMAFVVPGQSTESAISAEAAREVFGMGGNGGAAAPWTDPAHYFVRNANTGTQQMIGHAIGVPAAQFWGTDVGSASAVDQTLKVIGQGTEANESIGIISVDWYDSDRGNLKGLAFQATGQECGYLPDSTKDSTDKQNVRDGHYPIWGPLHFFTSNPPSTTAQAFLSVATVPRVDQTVLDAFIGASLVPSCAMTVQRSTELGALSTYSAPFQCDCYFVMKQGDGTLPSECSGCDATHPCPANRPACNLGFCEIQ